MICYLVNFIEFVVLAQASMGLRVGEALALRAEDLRGKSVLINKQIIRTAADLASWVVMYSMNMLMPI